MSAVWVVHHSIGETTSTAYLIKDGGCLILLARRGAHR
jgi:hypothetical protein